MMVCEELQCDWSKVRPQYASANRDGREMAPKWTLEVMRKRATDPNGGGRPPFRTTTYGQVASLAAQMPHPNPERIRIKPPSEWTLMGTEQKNLDVPLKVTGKTVYGIDVRLPGMKWAAVKSCPVYGGKVKSYDFQRIRNQPGVISAIEFPIPDPKLIRGHIFGGGIPVIADSSYQAKTALDKMPIVWDVPPNNSPRNTANMPAALLAAMD